MTTIGIIGLLLIVGPIYLVYRLIKWGVRAAKEQYDYRPRHYRPHHYEDNDEEETLATQEPYDPSSDRYRTIAKTSVVNRNRVYISNRKYYSETTFMITYQDGTRRAMTVRDGTEKFDHYMSFLEEM